MRDSCPYDACDGSGFVVDEEARTATACRCRPQRISARRARSLSRTIPRKFRDYSSFDRLDTTFYAPSVLREVQRFVRDLDEELARGNGLWFFGGVGTGKTTLAMLVSQFALERGHSVAIYSLPRLLAEIRTTFEDDSEHSYTELMDRLTEVELLHIDDVGAEKTSPWVLEQLYAIVNARYEEERSIVLTTNLTEEELADQITPRTVSRLQEMCEIYPIEGPDRRVPEEAVPERLAARAAVDPVETPERLADELARARRRL